MAWRDSRGSRKRLLLAMSAISVGIAACMAITAFDANVRAAVHNQARALLGADLVLSSRQPFDPETEALLATLGGSNRAKSVVRPWPISQNLLRLAWCRSEPWREISRTMGRWKRCLLERYLLSGLACRLWSMMAYSDSLMPRLARRSRLVRSRCQLLAGSP